MHGGGIHMNATADLRSEHGGVLRMLDIMDAMAARLHADEPVDAGDIEQTIEFLRVFADQCHHTKEETLLFPAMRTAAISSAEETIAVLIQEHVEARAAVAAIAESAQRLAAGDTAAADLAAEVTAYTGLLRSHIRREESDCFDPADAGLPAGVQDELIEGYERIERDVVGEGRHEAFHALLDRLAASYVS